MYNCTFTIPGEPRGKGRPRFMRNGHTYTPPETTQYEKLVRQAYIKEVGDRQLFPRGMPVEVQIKARFGVPASTPKSLIAKMLNNFLLPLKKPDADNIGKIVCDALNPIVDKKTGEVLFSGAYHDDAQVTDLVVRKRHGAPGVHVTLKTATVEEDNDDE